MIRLIWSSDLELPKLLRVIYQGLLYWLKFQLNTVCENLELKGNVMDAPSPLFDYRVKELNFDF